MIRFDPAFNSWVSGKNPDDQGMPTSNLTGDLNVCTCNSCMEALINEKGDNLEMLPT